MAIEVEHRQVIVIGAGPAGSACAQKLSESGVDVLVIERKDIIGNPAQCGECIPNWGEVVATFSNLDDHQWLKTYFDFPDRLRLHRLDNMRVFLPSGKSYKFELDAFSGHRLQFDGFLGEKAIQAGAEIRCGEALKKIQHQSKLNRDLLVTDKGRYSCDYLIDASGSLAQVARLTKGQDDLYRPKDQIPTIYAQVQGKIPDSFDVFIGSVAPSGYAWIIPKGPNSANVGLGVRAGKLEGNLKQYLQKFCDDLNLAILSWGGGWIAMGGPVESMVSGTTLAVGDAAGLVMPSNGGGISQAIISGCFAAEAIIDNLENGTNLLEYENRVRASFSRALNNSLRSKKMSYAFMNGDLVTEVLLRILGPIGGIKRAMECDKPLWLI